MDDTFYLLIMRMDADGGMREFAWRSYAHELAAYRDLVTMRRDGAKARIVSKERFETEIRATRPQVVDLFPCQTSSES